MVIATHRRPELLRDALRSLGELEGVGSQVEIVVADNGPDEATRLEAERAGVVYVEEPRRGAAIARNTGWKRSSGDIVAFIDDECVVPPGWARAGLGSWERNSPSVLGGPFEPHYRGSVPEWVRDEYYRGPKLEGRGPIPIGEYLSAANLWVDREVLEWSGGFDEQIGPRSRSLAYGEETEWQRRVRARRPELLFWFEPDLTVGHTVREEKLSPWWLLRSAFAIGRDSPRALGTIVDRPPSDLAVRTLGRSGRLLLSLLAVPFRDADRFRHVENYLVEVCGEHVRRLGAHYAAWQRLF